MDGGCEGEVEIRLEDDGGANVDPCPAADHRRDCSLGILIPILRVKPSFNTALPSFSNTVVQI